MEYQCSLCNKKIGSDLLVYVKHTKEHIVDEIKSKHPEWVEADGICQKCIDYYNNQMKGER